MVSPPRSCRHFALIALVCLFCSGCPGDDPGTVPDAGSQNGQDADQDLGPSGDNDADANGQADTDTTDDDAGNGADEGCGIAADYPGDDGIEDHPDVLLAEDFEHASIAVLEDRFTDIRNPELIDFVDDVAADSPGTTAVRLQSAGSDDTGSHLYRNLDEMDGETFDELYVRYYVQYDRDHSYHHSGVGMGGYNPPTNWPQGGAGTRPDGDDRFTMRAEPVGSDLQFDMYTYWMHMRGNPGDDNFWGNTFLGGVDLPVPDRDWIAVELRIQLNDPVDEYNGELTMWVDGQQIVHLEEGAPPGEWIHDTFYPEQDDEPFEGFQWRDDPSLDLSFLWLHQYVTGNEEGEHSYIWYNDVVLATDYIGPVDGTPCP